MTGWPSTPGEQLIRLARGFWVTQALYVAAELGLADLLADGPQAADDLAAAAGAHAPSLYRVLRLLAGEGVFAEDADGRFALTPMAAALRRDAGPARLQVLFLGAGAYWQAAGGLLHTVRTGETAFARVHGHTSPHDVGHIQRVEKPSVRRRLVRVRLWSSGKVAAEDWPTRRCRLRRLAMADASTRSC